MNKQIYRKLYYQEHKELEKKRARAWVKKHKKEVAEYKKNWKLKNKDKVKQYDIKHRHSERRKKWEKEYCLLPKVKERERARSKKTHPLYMAKIKRNKIYHRNNKEYFNILVKLDIHGTRRKYKETCAIKREAYRRKHE